MLFTRVWAMKPGSRVELAGHTDRTDVDQGAVQSLPAFEHVQAGRYP